MRSRSALLAAICWLLALTGCISVGMSSRETGTGHNIIESSRIAEVINSSMTAYEVIRKLEPHWLQKRAPHSAVPRARQEWEGDIQVYLNGDRLGGTDNLHVISADALAWLRYLNAAEATRYGMGHQHGAILVQTR